MQSQVPDKKNNSEEIYQHMIEEVFDVPEVEKARATKNFLGAGFSNKILQDTKSIDNLLSETDKHTDSSITVRTSWSIQNYY